MVRSTSRLKLLLTTHLPAQVDALFRSRFDCFEATDDPLRVCDDIRPDALLCSIGGVRFDAATIAALPASVRALATYSVGYDHIDLAAARARGLAVFNTPGVLADSVADAALLLMLGAARRATESIALIRGRAWPGWHTDQLLGQELAGKQLGILGMGEIGRRVARRARAFGMNIAYSNRRPSAEADDARFVSDPGALVEMSDMLVLAWPSTTDTRRFIDADRLAAAKSTLVLVNIGRGDLVDDEALIAALAAGRIYAAGLDVFDGEPNVNPRYFELPNVFMLPHIGSSTLEARLAMGEILVAALLAWEAGVRSPNRLV
jgi:glyoxylate reductase